MSSIDGLFELRQAIKSNERINLLKDGKEAGSLVEATHIQVSPSLSLPKSSPTRLRKPSATSADPSANTQDFFSLDAVYLAWKLRDASSADYMKQTRENGLTVGFVSVTERKKLVDWLEGKVNDLERIVPLPSESTTPPGTPPRNAWNHIPVTPAVKAGELQSSPTKRKYVADTSDLEAVKKIKANEIELQDRSSVLRGAKSNNFTSLRNSFGERLKKAKEVGKSGTTAMTVATPAGVDPKLQAKKARHQYPIIIISSSPTSLVTMHNVKRFLQDATYETSQDARARAAAEGNLRPEDVIPIDRKRTTIDSSGRETEIQSRYFVVDSTEALSKFGQDAWDRVICVMTTGQAWQFKPYKWNDPKILFHHVKGFYVSLTSDPPNVKIKDWNVTELKIDPNRRHVDKSVVAQFWKTLDAWTMQNKPWLIK